MKKKDVFYLMVAVVILLVAGYLAYTQLFPSRTASNGSVTVEKIGSIPSQLDQTALDELNDPNKVHDYSSAYDVTGLGNGAPFGP